MGLIVIKDLGQLVNKTYDKALMSSTFAQSARFDFSQYDREVQEALLAEDQEEFDLHLKKAKKYFVTLGEDLKVVEERSISSKAHAAILNVGKLLTEIESFRITLLSSEKPLLNSQTAINNWKQNKNIHKIYRSLNSISDDAAEVGYHFRLSSENKNIETLQQTVLTFVSCLLLSLALTFGISFVIIKPLRKLENVCEEIAHGNFTVRSDITGKDEFGTLAHSFNFMLDEIEDKTESMSTLLSSLPFGLFYFDSSGRISSERSKATDSIFKNFSQYQTVEDFYKDNGCLTKDVQDILSALFEKLLPFKSAVFLLPNVIIQNSQENSQIIKLSYRPKLDSKGKLEKIILLAEDVTEKENAKLESQTQAERVERLSRISIDIGGYKEFLVSIRDLFRSLKAPATANDFARDLHSLKGLLGIYAYSTVANMVHELENDLTKLNDLEKIMKEFEDQTKDVVDILAIEEDNSMKYFDKRKIKDLSQLISKENNPRLKAAIESLDRFSIEKAFAKYTGHTKALVKKLEDKKVLLEFAPSDEISFSEVQRLDTIFIHVLNNSIDHGIESVTERYLKNKPPIGKIEISFRRLPDNSLNFKISDDGKGINGQALFEKAIEKGIISESESASFLEDDKLKLIFKSGLSSKKNSSVLSGRGVGMDAVKTNLDVMGGTIQLSSRLDVGTTFELKIPPLDIT